MAERLLGRPKAMPAAHGARAAGPRPQPHSLREGERTDPRQLTVTIGQCRDAQEVLELASKHAVELNHIHWSSAWNCLGKHARGILPATPRQQVQIETLLRRTLAVVPSCGT